MVEATIFVSLAVLAVLAIESRVLRLSVIYLGIFSLLISFLYLYYNAPDVAIAEAVMASGLTTLLFLTALKRYRVYRICFTNEAFQTVTDRYIVEGTRRGALLHEIEQFCIARELEPQIVCTPESLDAVSRRGRYDLIIRQEGDELRIYGDGQNYLVDELEVLLILHYHDLNVRFVRTGESSDRVDESADGTTGEQAS